MRQSINLQNSAYVQLVDQSKNIAAPESIPEAVYCNSLAIPSGTTLDLNGLNLYTYAANSQISGSVINGQIQFIGSTTTTTVHLKIATQPVKAAAETTVSPAISVDVLDSFGNVVIANKSTVTISIASGPSGGTLDGTATATVMSGVATFGNLSFSVAGNLCPDRYRWKSKDQDRPNHRRPAAGDNARIHAAPTQHYRRHSA